jgi:hypothetical protein
MGYATRRRRRTIPRLPELMIEPRPQPHGRVWRRNRPAGRWSYATGGVGVGDGRGAAPRPNVGEDTTRRDGYADQTIDQAGGVDPRLAPCRRPMEQRPPRHQVSATPHQFCTPGAIADSRQSRLSRDERIDGGRSYARREARLPDTEHRRVPVRLPDTGTLGRVRTRYRVWRLLQHLRSREACTADSCVPRRRSYHAPPQGAALGRAAKYVNNVSGGEWTSCPHPPKVWDTVASDGHENKLGCAVINGK